jgi:hypothetical protein
MDIVGLWALESTVLGLRVTAYNWKKHSHAASMLTHPSPLFATEPRRGRAQWQDDRQTIQVSLPRSPEVPHTPGLSSPG